jgi:hypothetical protein
VDSVAFTFSLLPRLPRRRSHYSLGTVWLLYGDRITTTFAPRYDIAAIPGPLIARRFSDMDLGPF